MHHNCLAANYDAIWGLKKMKNNKLSIGIVAYRNYEDIKTAIRTLQAFTPESVAKRIFIVDNSDWEEPQRVRFIEYLQSYQDVEYIDTKANLGFGKGHNYILDRIDSDYHCIMNPDIVFNEDAFTPIISYLDSHPDVGMVIPRITDVDGKLQAVYRKELTVVDMFIRMFCKGLFPKRVAAHTLQYMDYSKPFQVPFGQGSFLVIRNELFRSLGGFDDEFFMYLEDADLCKRVNQKSKLMYIPDAAVIHKWRKGSHKDMRLFKIHLVSMRYYFNKWGWKWA